MLQFQPDVPVTDAVSGYIPNPSLNGQVHCVLFVLDAVKLTSYPSSLKSTLRKLHTTISDLGERDFILCFYLNVLMLIAALEGNICMFGSVD